MPSVLSHGTVKPPLGGAQVNWAHPFVRNLLFGFWCQSPIGTVAMPTWGSTVPRTVTSTFSGMGSNAEGPCAMCTAVTQAISVGVPDPIPAARVTLCLIRRKTDTTFRNPGFSFGNGSAGTSRCAVAAPFSDGITYWDFGGTAAPTRLNTAVLTYSTTVPERWIFVAGSRGMAIWRNGVKLASTATANPGRAQQPAVGFPLNTSTSGNGDLQDINFFMAIDDQWDDALCRAWSAEPYAHLYPPLRRRVLAGVAAAGTTARTQVTMIGPW